jgi:trehalose 6-phosphate synthase/phosphatase
LFELKALFGHNFEMCPPPPDSRLLIVSNRLPVSVRWKAGRPELLQSTGGLATGLGALRGREGSLWIGWPGDVSQASEAESREIDARLRERALLPVYFSQREISGFYDGFSNGVLWPLFHYLQDRVPIDSGGWRAYSRANERFADQVAAVWRPGDRIWVHDYHLMLLPKLLRERLPQASIGYFLHIPFPAPDVFRALPWRQALLEGLLGADLIGFHTPSYARHFTHVLQQLAAVKTAVDHFWWQGRQVRVGAFPMGIDDERFAMLASDIDVRARAEAIRSEAHGRRIFLGIDRLDYTKGIPRRLLAFQRLLEREPSLRDRVRFIQVAVPSRIDVRAYHAFRKELDELIGRVNGQFGTVDAVPIHYLFRSVSRRELVALYRAADVMVVTPLRDGMNLVAKEFCASRIDDDGVLLLSEFAGAADELVDAFMVNPYDIDGVADAMGRALALPGDERRRRMRALRARVQQSSIHRWASGFLDRLAPSERLAADTASAPSPALAAIEAGRAASDGRVTVLLDYDGTLVPFAASPELAVPDAGLMRLLGSLAAHPLIDLHLVTGRSRETADRWFGELPAELWAEHGAARRSFGHQWEWMVPQAPPWKAQARTILQAIAAETPGSLVEEKGAGLAWHYRLADQALASRQRARIRERVADELADAPIDLLTGHMVLELRPHGASKGIVARRILDQLTQRSHMVAIGDDTTDEEMFAALPETSTTIRVGGGATIARHHLADQKAVRQLLSELLATAVPPRKQAARCLPAPRERARRPGA